MGLKKSIGIRHSRTSGKLAQDLSGVLNPRFRGCQEGDRGDGSAAAEGSACFETRPLGAPQHEATLFKFLIPRRSRSGRLEGRTTPIQPIIDFLTAPFGRVTNGQSDSQRLNTNSIDVFCMSLSAGALLKKSLV